jgi:hypothetical protein
MQYLFEVKSEPARIVVISLVFIFISKNEYAFVNIGR